MLSPSPRGVTLTTVTLAVVLLVSTAVLVQAQSQAPPFYREDGGPSPTLVGGKTPSVILNAAQPVFMDGNAALALSMHYKCVSNVPATGNPSLEGNCSLGTAASPPSIERLARAFYTLNGTLPVPPATGCGTATTPNSQQLSTSGSTPNYADETFSGSIPATVFTALKDGDVVTFVVCATLSPFAPGSTAPTCNGASRCFDPLNTTGQAAYRLRIDRSTPTILVGTTANSFGFQVSPTQAYIYSNAAISAQVSGSSLLPEIVITVLDDFNGSRLDHARTQFWRNGTQVTANFVGVGTNTNHTATYRYNYPSGGTSHFPDGTATRIGVIAWDEVGHKFEAVGNGTNQPAVWLIMDNTPPVLDHGASYLKRAPGSTGLASLQEKLHVHINATDHGGNNVNGGTAVPTPKQLLKVEVELVSNATPTLRTPKVEVPYNATLGYHYSADIGFPATWASGGTHANVTITDPVGQTTRRNINGTVNVDVDTPTVTPLDPITATQSTGYTRQTNVPFTVRATDPGDADPWNGAGTTDTDFLGIALDGVMLHYRVGANGTTTSVQLSPQTAENTFSGTRTFNADDQVYYYFTGRDRAGNTVAYPGPTDPSVNLTGVTENGGRFLSLVVDRTGPVITESRDHAFLGAGPHEIRLQMVDAGSGTDAGTARLLWRVQGATSFNELTMIASGTGAQTVYTAQIPAQPDGTRIQWHATANDVLGNVGTLGSATTPRLTVIDTVAPTVTMTAPGTSANALFNISWIGSDAGSGVSNYTLQFRVAGGNWFTVPSRTNTTETAYQFCAAGGKTYEFRVHVRDRAGNARIPTAADASTQVTSTTDCAQPAEVAVLQPATGATISGATTVQWNAVSTAFPEDIVVRIELGAGGTFTAVATGLDSTGSRPWNSHAPATADTCFVDGQYTLRVTAVDPHGLEGSASVPVTLSNGITDCADRDNDDLPDAWEFEHFGHLNFDANDDSDSDGATNLAEFQAGTNPDDANSRPSGIDNPGGWNDLYILVILAFVAVLGVFAVGITRRW